MDDIRLININKKKDDYKLNLFKPSYYLGRFFICWHKKIPSI